MIPRWREHEKRSKKSSLYNGYNVTEQKKSRSTGKRPDFFGISKACPKERIVGDAKWCVKARKNHINQVSGYKKHPFYAQKAVIHYPLNAIITDAIRDYAKEKNIKIVRTREKKEPQQYLFGLFRKKSYER